MRNVGLLTLVLASAATLQAQPIFTKVFAPDTIGPGSISTLTFTINNTAGPTTTGLAFSDMLPAAVTIATPANAATTCLDATLTAPDGGATISMSGGRVGAGDTCSVTVDVTSSAPDAHMNMSGALTPCSGMSCIASDDLTVATNRPGFSKSFSPASVSLGGRSTLTFTIDNTLNPSLASSLEFTDNLPPGIVVAGPSNTTNTCAGGVTAVPGSSFISLGPGAVGAMTSCTVTVDVIGNAVGTHNNLSGELTSEVTSTSRSSGKATGALTVTVAAISLIKSFTDDPVPPGGTVTLEFTITNLDRNFSATNIDFSDVLPAGLSATGSMPTTPCGAGSVITGTTTLSFMDGTLPPEGTCTFSVTLSVPSSAMTGSFTNTTSTIAGEVDGSMVTGAAASEIVVISPAPLLTKLFVGDPVGTGGSVIIRFTITNPSSTSATDIAFIDELTTFLPVPVGVTLPGAPCGGSISLVNIGGLSDREGLSLTGGTLLGGAMCTFDVTLTIPVGQAGGTFTNTTMEPTATVGGTTVTGKPASDDLVIASAPSLLKEFTNDPLQPGGTATLQFTLTHNADAPGSATGVAFSDDLAAVLPGGPDLTATGLPLSNICGAVNGTLGGSVGDTLLTFSGATLTPGQVCTFSVTLNVPGSAPIGSHTNTTSTVTATVSGVTATGNAATDNLQISTLTFTKAFTDDPIIPGGTGTLRFTITTASTTVSATGIEFDDDLDDTLSGLVSVAPLPTSPCGAGSTLTGVGTGLLKLLGGSLAVAPGAGSSCTFDVTVMVPAMLPGGVTSGTFINTISPEATLTPGGVVTFSPNHSSVN